jgi:hypothetical protein
MPLHTSLRALFTVVRSPIVNVISASRWAIEPSFTHTDCPFGDAYARRWVGDWMGSGEPSTGVALSGDQATDAG